MPAFWKSGPTLGSIRSYVRIDQEIVQSSWNLAWTFFNMCSSYCENFIAFGLVDLKLWSIQDDVFWLCMSFESISFESILSNRSWHALSWWCVVQSSSWSSFFSKLNASFLDMRSHPYLVPSPHPSIAVACFESIASHPLLRIHKICFVRIHNFVSTTSYPRSRLPTYPSRMPLIFFESIRMWVLRIDFSIDRYELHRHSSPPFRYELYRYEACSLNPSLSIRNVSIRTNLCVLSYQSGRVTIESKST